jgi:hypothetical protein
MDREGSEEPLGVKCTWLGVWMHGWSAWASSRITAERMLRSN